MSNFDLLIAVFVATLQIFTGFIIPVVFISIFNPFRDKNLETPFILAMATIMIGCLLTLFYLVRTAEYNRGEIKRTAQILIDNGVTNTIDTNIQYHIDILLIKSQLEEKYGHIEEISIIK